MCGLDELIEQTYGKEIGVPYLMEERLVQVDVSPIEDEDGLVTLFLNGPEEEQTRLMVEALLNDLCFKGLLQEGEHLLSFDD
tara:strand:+ start:997 stop:1242 length:246 start_codon:yes stop_codon:yes gene_type:complete